MKDDLSELIERIYFYSEAYRLLGRKAPLFKITPYENLLLLRYSYEVLNYRSLDTYGVLPSYFGIDFELVGKPLLFEGKHIRSDSGIEVEK